MSSSSLTQILRRASGGSRSAANELMPLIYDELRALAQHYLGRERTGHTLQATALVNEAYLKLINQKEVEWRDRSHFFAVAATAIRRILVDHARARNAEKRGGGRQLVQLDASTPDCAESAFDLVALDEALGSLAALNERQARIVEMRFFGGLTIDEVAGVLEIGPRTVDDDWSMARAWLKRRLDPSDG